MLYASEKKADQPFTNGSRVDPLDLDQKLYFSLA
jgi:hypothetical protein